MNASPAEITEVKIERVFSRGGKRVKIAFLHNKIEGVTIARPLKKIELNFDEQSVIVEGKIIENIHAQSRGFQREF